MLVDDLTSVFKAITETLFSASLTLVEADALQAPEEVAVPALSSRVDYGGGFRGALLVTISERLARALAGRMLKMPAADCTVDDVRDALGEITNIAAGNIKSLLRAPCQVSLPRVQDGTRVPREDQESLARAQYEMFGEPLWAELRGDRSLLRE